MKELKIGKPVAETPAPRRKLDSRWDAVKEAAADNVGMFIPVEGYSATYVSTLATQINAGENQHFPSKKYEARANEGILYIKRKA